MQRKRSLGLALAMCVAVMSSLAIGVSAGETLEVVASPKAPEAIGAYSQAIVVGSFVFTSGNLPLDPATGTMPEDVGAQAKQALDNIKVVLEEAGTSMSKVVKTTIFLADIKDFAVVNEIYSGYFTPPYPARSCIAVKDIPRGAKLEIEVVAVK